MTENSLVQYGEMGLADTMQLGSTLAQSGYFADAKEAAQAVVKVLAGRELGFGPVASMTGIYVIKGRVSLGANLMAQAVKRSTKYDYRVVELTGEAAEIAFFEGSVELGRSRFDKDDAVKAGTQNINKFARNMLFARAMSNGVKWYCPDVFSTTVYTPEELGEQVDGDGEIINVTPTVVTKPPEAAPSGPKPEPAPVTTNGNGHKAYSWPGETIKAVVDAKYAEAPPHAIRILAHSEVLTPDTEIPLVLSWCQEYRRARDEGLDSVDAALAADGLIAPEMPA